MLAPADPDTAPCLTCFSLNHSRAKTGYSGKQEDQSTFSTFPNGPNGLGL